MQTIKWFAFGISDALTSTLVHFFPSAGVVTAPYPAQCKLGIFGQSLESKSVILDGARLSQPDGVRLEDAFPLLRRGPDHGPRTPIPELYGIEVEITTSQPRISLDSSSCVIELAMKGLSARYVPRNSGVVHSDGLDGTCIKDGYQTTSLVVVNSGLSPYRPDLFFIDDKGEMIGVTSQETPSSTVQEIFFDNVLFKDAPALHCSWGLVRTRSLSVRGEVPQGVSLYILYRDANNRRPLSIMAL